MTNGKGFTGKSLILLTICSALAVVLVFIVSMGGRNYPAQSGVSNFRTAIDGRYYTDVSAIDGAVIGKTRADVVSLLGNPDCAAPKLDLIRFFRPGVQREVLYYREPKFGMDNLIQAVELSDNKVTFTYKTLPDAWLLFYAAISIVAIAKVAGRMRRPSAPDQVSQTV